MRGIDDVRRALAAVEIIAPMVGCHSVSELELYAERVVKLADRMEYSDVSNPESVLVAALILRLQRRLAHAEGSDHVG